MADVLAHESGSGISRTAGSGWRARLLLLLALVSALVLTGTTPAGAALDDFTFDSFHADYTLERDEQGVSELSVVETLVARFPDYDQNRGVQRALVKRYDGRDTRIAVLSVTDENGAPRPFWLEEEDEFLLVNMAGQDYVHGEQHYVISYTQRGVTKEYRDTARDEFYWDVNGTGWAQPFGAVSATVHLGESIPVTGGLDSACYAGYEGGNTVDCTAGWVDERTFEAAAEGLRPYQNLTLAIGFAPGTFTPMPMSPGERMLELISNYLLLAEVLLILAILGIVVWLRSTRYRDAPGRGIRIVQYTPPEDERIAESAALLRVPGRAMSATLIDLAVRGVIEIEDLWGGSSAPAFPRQQDRYRLRLISPMRMTVSEMDFITTVFGSHKTGAERTVQRYSSQLRKANENANAAAEKQVKTSGKIRMAKAPLLTVLVVVSNLLLAVLVMSWLFTSSLADQIGSSSRGLEVLWWTIEPAQRGLWNILLLAVGVVAIVAISVLGGRRRFLTGKGAQARDYLHGIRDYLALAEQDRIRMLQSPEGAERVRVNTADPYEVVKLYERLLPYAVLLGVENEWNKVLSQQYETAGRQPEWYQGSHFNSGSLVALRASVAGGVAARPSSGSSYSSSGGFSSSGGSSGGGFSGGGGGGGGGRGL